MINFIPATIIFAIIIFFLFYSLLFKTQELDRFLKSLSAMLVILLFFVIVLVSNFDFAIKNIKSVNLIDFQSISDVSEIKIDDVNNSLINGNSERYLIKTNDGKVLLISKYLLKDEKTLSEYLNKGQSGKISFQLIEKEPYISWLSFIKIDAISIEQKAVILK